VVFLFWLIFIVRCGVGLMLSVRRVCGLRGLMYWWMFIWCGLRGCEGFGLIVLVVLRVFM